MTKAFLITDNRFILIAILLMIIFFSFLTFFYLKADEVTRDPCSICSERMGEEILCTVVGSFEPITRTYNTDGSIENVQT